MNEFMSKTFIAPSDRSENVQSAKLQTVRFLVCTRVVASLFGVVVPIPLVTIRTEKPSGRFSLAGEHLFPASELT